MPYKIALYRTDLLTSRRPFLFALAIAMGLLSPRNCPAEVALTMPHNIVISKMGDYGDLIFFLFANGQIEKGFLLDPKTAGEAGQVQLPHEGLPKGKLVLLGVPRALAEKSKAPDPAWLTDAPPGVVRVTGVIHHYPVQKSSALHQYQLDKTEEGLQVTLLNPDVLTSYTAEAAQPEQKSEPPNLYLWIALAGGAAVVIAGVLVWSLQRRGSAGG